MQWAKCPSHKEEKYEEKKRGIRNNSENKIYCYDCLHRNCKIIGDERDCWGRRR